MGRIRKLLVANRGEIACRVMRTARDQGIATVAVYSEPDATAPHVLMADEAVLIGPGPVGQSYLVPEKILAAAAETKADAVHPGYGFLSENADFAAAVEAAGLIFVGPSAEAIDLMGNKAAAKRRMIEAGVPCVPGYEGADQKDEILIAEGEKIGFPIMVKAAAGGGGRGMRLVEAAEGLPAAITTARSEAENAFGSGELILEKAIVKPRHVEVQVFADSHGNVIHLGERDCSVQRRHQKVIEEAPCPVMTPELRDAMGGAAVEAARSINYRGAGTVEFLLDAGGEFYFLEMNTRLQVEHPVTEEVTGLDLVALQLRVAEGGELDLPQEEVFLDGSAIEVRLYAEDPANKFLPCTGIVNFFDTPSRPGVRVDAGIVAGQEISPFYDPMIAKIITYSETREVARKLMVDVLRETALFGVRTNRDFLIACLENDRFADGAFSTAFIAEEFGEEGFFETPPGAREMAVLGVRHYLLDRGHAFDKTLNLPDALFGFTSNEELYTSYLLACGDETSHVIVRAQKDGSFVVNVGDETLNVTLRNVEGARAVMLVDGETIASTVHLSGDTLHGLVGGRGLDCVNLLAKSGSSDEGSDGRRVLAPMHGRVVEVFVAAGDAVQKGERLAIIEAMKMQHDILAEIDGSVDDLLIEIDQQVGAEDLMITIAADDE
jgi:geranyl-CoA carboxylase alpha subunit